MLEKINYFFSQKIFSGIENLSPEETKQKLDQLCKVRDEMIEKIKGHQNSEEIPKTVSVLKKYEEAISELMKRVPGYIPKIESQEKYLAELRETNHFEYTTYINGEEVLCSHNYLPDFKEIRNLIKYLSERGRYKDLSYLRTRINDDEHRSLYDFCTYHVYKNYPADRIGQVNYSSLIGDSSAVNGYRERIKALGRQDLIDKVSNYDK